MWCTSRTGSWPPPDGAIRYRGRALEGKLRKGFSLNNSVSLKQTSRSQWIAWTTKNGRMVICFCWTNSYFLRYFPSPCLNCRTEDFSPTLSCLFCLQESSILINKEPRGLHASSSYEVSTSSWRILYILTLCIHPHPQRSQCMGLELVLLSFDLVSEESVRNNFQSTKPSAMPQCMQ